MKEKNTEEYINHLIEFYKKQPANEQTKKLYIRNLHDIKNRALKIERAKDDKILAYQKAFEGLIERFNEYALPDENNNFKTFSSGVVITFIKEFMPQEK